MILGQEFIAIDVDRTFFTSWFPRGADNAVFTLEVIHSNLTGTLVVTAYTKDSEDPGSSPTSAGTFSQLGGTDLWTLSATSLQQLVRFKVTVPAGNEGGIAESVVLRFLPPTWFATARVA